MSVTLALLIIVCFVDTSTANENVIWDYHTHGPHTWGSIHSSCLGNRQSPINIVTDKVKVNYDLPHIHRNIFYPIPTNMSISNNGHTISVDYNECAYEIVRPKLLPFTAKMAGFHFHWAKAATEGGSEHTIDGKRFYGELHAVHYNTKYPNLSVAMDKHDGLAVFGWFLCFEASLFRPSSFTKQVQSPHTNRGFQHFLDAAKDGAENKGESMFITPFSLATLLPSHLAIYYRYAGSLTTPGCHESVLWTVFKEPIQISCEQATFLSTMFYQGNNARLNENYRPVQPLNGRIVTRPPPPTALAENFVV